jgi:hypothetical protein
MGLPGRSASAGFAITWLSCWLSAAPAAFALDLRRYPASTSSALDATVEPHIVTPLPAETLSPSDLPASWDWRNVSTGLADTSGEAFFQNLVTIPRNQHIPQCTLTVIALRESSVQLSSIRVHWPAP